jgi:hypothetical protein
MNSAQTSPSSSVSKSLLVYLGILSWVLLSASCRTHTPAGPAASYYYNNPAKDWATVGRVVLVELDNDSTYPNISVDVTEALFKELQKKQLFGVKVARQTDPEWRSLQSDADGPYTLEQLDAMRKGLGSKAILVGRVTSYRPYPHMTIGLRLRLVDLTDGQLLWALEQIWDAADKATEKRIRDYFQARIRTGFAPLRERLAAVSSVEFIKFVSYEVAETFRRKR